MNLPVFSACYLQVNSLQYKIFHVKLNISIELEAWSRYNFGFVQIWSGCLNLGNISNYLQLPSLLDSNIDGKPSVRHWG